MGYEVPIVVKREILKEGEIVANGDEQVLIEVVGTISLEGYVDLSEMNEGDAVTLRRYVRIINGDDYKLHAEETYYGKQREPLIRFPPIAGRYGIMVTIQQISGTFKKFKYQFFKEA